MSERFQSVKMTMTSKTIESLLQQLADKLPAQEQQLVTALRNEIEQLTQTKQPASSTTALPKKDETGCYRISNDAAFYCPNCYDQRQLKVPTQRLNRKLRVCPQCRASIRPAI
jgi:predicted RNA-binding Zn-ribbon protein involved in translation (DUF1610 family)